MVDRKAPGPYIATLSGIVGGTALQHLFGWDNGTMAVGRELYSQQLSV
jgi:hypothetical protein